MSYEKRRLLFLDARAALEASDKVANFCKRTGHDETWSNTKSLNLKHCKRVSLTEFKSN
jgi:hypothetical protein